MKAIQQISKLKGSLTTCKLVESGWSTCILRKMQRKYKLNEKFFIVPTLDIKGTQKWTPVS